MIKTHAYKKEIAHKKLRIILWAFLYSSENSQRQREINAFVLEIS